MFWIHRSMWSVFAGICLAGAYVALSACILRIPYFGVVVSRCPLTLEPPSLRASNLNQLKAEVRELERAIVMAGTCPEQLPIPSLPPLSPLPSEPAPELANIDINPAVEIAVILDTSGSMKTKDGSPILFGLLQKSRWNRSKEAIVQLLENPPTTAPISVWGFGECDAPPVKLFPYNGKSPVDRFRPLVPESPTALAEAIEGVENMVEGKIGQSKDQGLNVVIFSDGDQGCGNRDVCDSARQLKKKMPYAWLHVVTLKDDLQSLACVARVTGGVVIDGKKSRSLFEILRTFSGSAK